MVIGFLHYLPLQIYFLEKFMENTVIPDLINLFFLELLIISSESFMQQSWPEINDMRPE